MMAKKRGSRLKCWQRKEFTNWNDG